ncbi:MAG: hypothetical protein IJ092_01190 [Atopobiaceae bacterium]|nr:hypothetical protein [Atopobiaceae bacterium]MBR1830232.1 hypothetical protein [Atopobiaceae bacterium]
MRVVAGKDLSAVKDAAIDAGLTLQGSLSWRSAAVGLVLPEYIVDEFRDIRALASWCWPVPDGAYTVNKEGVRYCTPEFTFLLMARLLDVEELALFGLELCGSYVIDKSDPRGFVADTVPQTTVAKLRAFLDGCQGAPGVQVARRALKWVVDRSASPMESMLVLLLCLPRHMGGYGLPLPELNVSADELRGLKASKNGPFADLIWRLARFALEYDSDLFHTGKDRIERDSKRRAFFEEMGIRSISVTNMQVNDSTELARIAKIVSKALGKKFHSVSLELKRRNASLRRRLYELTDTDPEEEPETDAS